MKLTRFAHCALAGIAVLVPALGQARAQGGSAWRFTELTPDIGLLGARRPALASDGRQIAFQHDADLAPGMPGNADANAEIFRWRAFGCNPLCIEQISATAAGMGRYPRQSEPGISADGVRLGFLSNADLSGGNPDHGAEVFRWEEAWGFRQISAGPAGSAAAAPALSRDGRALAFWHTADPLGANPDGGPELFLARDGAVLEQLTRFGGAPFQGRPALSWGGDRLAFVTDADLTGANPDQSWELFLWSGPAGAPGDPARFRQLTDTRPPMLPSELYDPSLSADGRRVAFGARGHVDASQPASHRAVEVYRWTEGLGLERLTIATQDNASSAGAWISDDGRHVFFLSLSNFGGGNPDRNAELYRWSEGGSIDQVTVTQGRPSVITLTRDAVPGVGAGGGQAAYLAELPGSLAPLVLYTRRGILVHAEDPDAPTAPPPTETPSPTVSIPPPTATPSAPGGACPQIRGLVPEALIHAALADPASVWGWGRLANPNAPPGPLNPPRLWLSLRDLGKPFGPANGLLWRAGCP